MARPAAAVPGRRRCSGTHTLFRLIEGTIPNHPQHAPDLYLRSKRFESPIVPTYALGPTSDPQVLRGCGVEGGSGRPNDEHAGVIIEGTRKIFSCTLTDLQAAGDQSGGATALNLPPARGD